MAETYILMNQKKQVLKFEFDKDLNIITKISDIYDLEYAPFSIKNEREDRRIKEFNNWFNDRAIPANRDNAKQLLELLGVSNVKELINQDYALSVTDQYWFKPEKEETTWEEINYFDKSYDSLIFAEATFGKEAGSSLKQSKSENSYKTPNNTTNGQLRKVWIKNNEENYLYKAAGSIHNLEPINEVIASKICKIIEVPFVEYTLDIIHSKRQDTLVSICKCAIDKNEEIIPAHSVLMEEKEKITRTPKDYYLYLEILKRHSVPKAEEYLQKMFMLDYILLNEDRHLNNFGIIRNVQTLEWQRICPIFDTGRSMNTNVTTSYWDFEEGEVKCFTSELISSKSLEEFIHIKISKEKIEKLKQLGKEYGQLLKKYQEYTRLTDQEIELLVNGYGKRIEIFEKIMG